MGIIPKVKSVPETQLRDTNENLSFRKLGTYFHMQSKEFAGVTVYIAYGQWG